MHICDELTLESLLVSGSQTLCLASTRHLLRKMETAHLVMEVTNVRGRLSYSNYNLMNTGHTSFSHGSASVGKGGGIYI